MLKYGDDSRQIESVMACFDRGVEKHTPPCSLHTVLQAAAYRVNKSKLKSSSKKQSSSSSRKDFQLQRALDLLKGIAILNKG